MKMENITNEFNFNYNQHKYRIPLKHKFNVLTGLSAIGKSSLVNFIDTLQKIKIIKPGSSIPIDQIRVHTSLYELEGIVRNNEECLVILDETDDILQALFIKTRTNLDRALLKELLMQTKCVFILITRNLKLRVPLPQDAVLELTNSDEGFTHVAQPMCSEQLNK